ncbi:hypothetical protein C2E23DRAFT_885303 [Lenzites betulinus]|nr:hypothetical protein C2E23DRAFT_885303 [Lenzites betulinus]
MSWFYDYRIFSYVVALASEIGVFVASLETHNAGKDVTGLSLTYATLGMAVAVVTAVPLLIVLVSECTNRPVPVRTELIGLVCFAPSWLAVAFVATHAQHRNFGYASCDSLDPIPSSICSYATPIVSYSFIPAGVLLSYGLFLLLIAGKSEWKKTPLWGHPVRSKAMKEAGY